VRTPTPGEDDPGAPRRLRAPSPEVLWFALSPIVLVFFLVLRHFGIVAKAPVWAYVGGLGVCQLAGLGAILLFLRRPGRLTRHLLVLVEVTGTTVMLYLTGWGPLVALGYVIGAQQSLARHGSVVANAATVWSVLGVAAGQAAIALNVAPSKLPGDIVQAAALPAALGVAVCIQMAGAAMRQKEEAEETVRVSEERFRSLVQHSSDLTLVLGQDSMITYASLASEQLLGRHPDDLIGTYSGDLVHPDDLVRLRHQLRGHLTHGTSAVIELRVAHADGTWRDVEAVVSDLSDSPAVRGKVVNARDVTERRLAESSLAHQATHDSLTGLPNRALLKTRLNEAVERLELGLAGRPALMFVDIDRFKLINDSLGHEVGDEVLVVVAERLRAAMRSSEMVSRFGGDEFVVLADSAGADPDRIAARLLRCFEDPVHAAGHSLRVGASIGVAVADAGHDPSDLLREADIAMYEAKALGRGRVYVFDPDSRCGDEDRVHAESELRDAFERDELRVVFQGIVDLDTMRAVGVEALLRWEHPTRGLLGPAEFLALAEESGLIVPIGAWVLRQATAQVAEWNVARLTELPLELNVNLSVRQLAEPSLVSLVESTLCASVPLCLEVTESLVVADPEGTRAQLDELRRLGVSVAIDDFGTGHSSLVYLRRFPVDIVKIDRRFVDGLGRDERDDVIVESVINLAHALGLAVVAEGVETIEQLERIRGLGCDRAQGYLLDRPASAEVFEAAVGRPRQALSAS
jgi:diguanylate cyclase (GGDEF)-like protein/PAS domain S-box-containing protein